MAIFPVSPTIGQEETVLGRTFVYDGDGWAAKDTSGHTFEDSAGNVLTSRSVAKAGAGIEFEDDEVGEKTVVRASKNLTDHIDEADEEKHGANQIAGLIPTTNIAPTAALKFDKNYWPDETHQFDLTAGNITLSLDSGVTNIVGFCNFFDVVADGVHSINLGTGFKSNGVFPSTLDGTILEAGTYMFFCIYSTNGIVINVPSLGGGTVIPDTPPYATNVYFTGQSIVGEQMTGWYTYNDDESDVESGTTYQWYRADDATGTNRVAISGATFKNYVVQSADENKRLQFEVVVANAKATGDAAQTGYSQAVSLTDTFPPEIVSASIDNDSPDTLVLIFDEVVTATNVGYTVKYDGVSQTINSLSGSGTNELIIVLNRVAQSGEVLTLDYDNLIGDTVDDNTNNLVSFTNKPITNNVQQSIIAAIPYNTDLTGAYSYESVKVDEVSGNITEVLNVVNTSMNLIASSTDSLRPQLSGNEILLLNKEFEAQASLYNFSSDGSFTAFFVIDSGDSDILAKHYMSGNPSVNRLVFNNTSVYVNGTLAHVKNSLPHNIGKHIVVMRSTEGGDIEIYIDDNSSPIRSQAASTGLVNSILFCRNDGVTTQSSLFKSFSEALFYDRTLSLVEIDIVKNSYLASKFNIAISNRPIISAFELTNVVHNSTIASGYNITFSITIADGRELSKIAIFQTDNGGGLTAKSQLIDGDLREFSITVPPFAAKANVVLGIFVMDTNGLVSNIIQDAAHKFTLTA